MFIPKIRWILFCLLLSALSLTFQEKASAQSSYASKIENLAAGTLTFDASLGKIQSKSTALSITNVGSNEWNKDRVFLSYHILDEQGNTLLADGERTQFEENVTSGKSLIVYPKISEPLDKDWYNRKLYIQFDLVEEGVQWFSYKSVSNTLKIPIIFTKTVDYTLNEYKEEISAFSKKNKTIEVTLTNTGTATWDPESLYSLSYHIVDKDSNVVVYDGLRSSFGKTVAPGETVKVLANVELPNVSGLYFIKWSIVRDGFSWFDNGTDMLSGSTKLYVHSELWMYLFGCVIAIGFLLLIYIIFNLIKKRKLDLLINLKAVFYFYLVRLDLVWFILSLMLKTKWATLQVTSSISSNYYIFVNGSIILCALALNLISRSKLRLIIVFFVNLFSSLILISDLAYFSYFQDVITAGSLINAGQLTGVSDSIYSLVKLDQVYVLFSDLFLFIPLYAVIRRFKKPFNNNSYNIVTITGVLIISIYLGLQFYKLTQVNSFRFGYQNAYRVQELGLINFHIYDATRFLSQKMSRLSSEEFLETQQWKETKRQPVSDQYTGIAKQQNVILIQSEALQNFVINLKVNNEEITPNLNEFVKGSFYFQNFYDQTNQGRTSDAEFTALNSLYPLASGSIYTTYGGNTFDALPQILGSYGYSTLSAHGYKGVFWNREEIHSRLGFQNSYFEEDLVLDEQIGMGLSDRTFFVQSVEKIKQLKQPYFAFLISLSNHYPFNESIPPEMKIDIGDLEGTLLGDYLNSVHYADYAFGELLKKLKSDNMMDNTVIALYGDHDAGIPFSEVKKVLSDWDSSKSEILYDKVPFIVHVEGKGGSIISTNSGHLDITPTLLDLLDINHNNNVFMGESIFSKTSPVIFRNGNYIGSDYISENGVCSTAGSFQECNEFTSEVAKQLSISDRILKYDLIPRLTNTE